MSAKQVKGGPHILSEALTGRCRLQSGFGGKVTEAMGMLTPASTAVQRDETTGFWKER